MIDYKNIISNGEGVLGIELGSTRIKAVLIDSNHKVISQGSYEWENRFDNGSWTYGIDEVWRGVQGAFKSLCGEIFEKYGLKLEKIAAFGVSAMMHGYLAFDKDGELLVPYRTWRNTTTEKASDALSEAFSFNIPQRFSVAHLYQAILNKEPHIKKLDYITTLSGYIHWKLTGEKVLGVGDASGMFPIDSRTNNYDTKMMDIFNKLALDNDFSLSVIDILPKVLTAGELAGTLTQEGAKLIDPSGSLNAGVRLCPPEGDAGTGMTATNCITAMTGNVSAGTSIFAMIVLENEMKNWYTEIDVVTTPTGKPTAMIHCNNCTSDLNAWVGLFGEAVKTLGFNTDTDSLYSTLYQKALEGEPDGGGLVSCNYFSGEHITRLTEGRPIFSRYVNSDFSLANFMRAHLYSSFATLRLGMDMLFDGEGVVVGSLTGHGGLFKTKLVAQKLMAGALNIPISVMENSGEGGPWGMALLASYMLNKNENQTLESFLSERVFANADVICIKPELVDVNGFNKYLTKYKAILEVERTAIKALN